MQWDVTEFVACSLLIDIITHVSYCVIEFVVFCWLIEFVTSIWVTHVMPCDVHTLVPFNYSKGRHDSLSSWHMHASLITSYTMWLSSWDLADSSSSCNIYELFTTCHGHTMRLSSWDLSDSSSSWNTYELLTTCHSHTMRLSSWDLADSSSSWNTHGLLTTCHSYTMCNACSRQLLCRQTRLFEFVVVSWLTDFVVVSWLTEFVTHAWVTHN